MVSIRQGTPRKEMWNAEKLSQHLNIDLEMAKKYFNDYHRSNGGGYGLIEKSLILDFVNQKQREEREREARYRSDLSNVESLTYLKDQVKFHKEQIQELRNMNRSTSKWSVVSNIIALVSLTVAIVSLCINCS